MCEWMRQFPPCAPSGDVSMVYRECGELSGWLGQGLVSIGVMKNFEKELYYERDIERLCVVWKIASLALSLEPSRGLFLLRARIVVSCQA